MSIMALAVRARFILATPKPNVVLIPSCISYKQKVMIMLQPHHGLKHNRHISQTTITCAAKKPGGGPGTGSGGQINQTRSAETLSASDMSSSSSSQKESKISTEGDANSTAPNKTAATN